MELASKVLQVRWLGKLRHGCREEGSCFLQKEELPSIILQQKADFSGIPRVIGFVKAADLA